MLEITYAYAYMSLKIKFSYVLNFHFVNSTLPRKWWSGCVSLLRIVKGYWHFLWFVMARDRVRRKRRSRRMLFAECVYVPRRDCHTWYTGVRKRIKAFVTCALKTGWTSPWRVVIPHNEGPSTRECFDESSGRYRTLRWLSFLISIPIS